MIKKDVSKDMTKGIKENLVKDDKKESDKKSMHVIERLAPDTSVIIDGLISFHIKSGNLKPETIIIHEAVVAELEYQANENKAIGYLGLDEILALRELSKEYEFNLEFSGIRPSPSQMRYAKLGEIDSMIRQLAFEKDAVLMTADKIQARIAEAKGMQVFLVKVEQMVKTLKLEQFFDLTTMSAHLRENVPPVAKKGFPGNWNFVYLRQEKLTSDEIKDVSREIIEEAGIRKDGFIEIERPGSTIVQLGDFRIVITKPPFSDGWEITAVRPVKKMKLEDYNLSEPLMERLSNQAEGILIAGAPGAGKSTFAAGLAIYYASKNKIVKTIEAPRDMVLPDTITQYALSHGDPQEIHDILLLSRPDYTLFDEMRNTKDFQLFADLRLAGIGLAGVVHATNPIDAIQRFVGRIELGMIPQVIDTVIFIKDGQPAKILSLKMVVKVPAGMTEADLARPIVVVTDFETKSPEYELYSYGEETVVVPVSGYDKIERKGAHSLAAKQIEREFREYTNEVKAEMMSDNKVVVYVPENAIAKIIGKQGSNISQIEKKLGIKIDVKELSEAPRNSNSRDYRNSNNGESRNSDDSRQSFRNDFRDESKRNESRSSDDSEHSESDPNSITFETNIGKKSVEIYLDTDYAGRTVDIIIDGDLLLSASVSKKGIIQIKKDHKIGKILMNAIHNHEKIELKEK